MLAADTIDQFSSKGHYFFSMPQIETQTHPLPFSVRGIIATQVIFMQKIGFSASRRAQWIDWLGNIVMGMV